ncbi:MAG: 4Fe-4S binding protein [Eggerthellaceae bacterium]|nr:4Fe-4S binding protein [Eggerthellaceae bacterium]
MPSINDVLGYANYLKVGQLAIVQDKCVAVRNRNAKCRRCQDVCFAGAITVTDNQVLPDPTACVDCGACAAVCPTFAIMMLEPTREKLAEKIARAADANTGLAVISCARAAAKHVADPERFCEVPCLAHVDDRLILEMAAVGLDDIVLVDGECATCKFGAADACIQRSVNSAADMLEATGAEVIITRESQFPEEVISGKSMNIRGEDRRGLLAQTGGYVGRVAANIAQKTIEEKLGGAQKKPKTLKERLSAGRSGRMPIFQPHENFRMLECLEKASRSESPLDASDSVMATPRFGRVAVDVDKCSGCGLCVLFCPTGALSHAEYDVPEDPEHKYLEFSADLCTQCGLCVDVCMRNCLTVDGHVRVGDLFCMEPELIEVSKPRERTSIFDLKRTS